FIFCFNMGFAVIKDYGDIVGDKVENKMTLPVVIGKKNTLIYQFVVITVVFAAMLYFALTQLGWSASVLLIIPYAIAMYAMSLVVSPKDRSAYSRASNIIRTDALLVMLILALYFIH
ncbi:MAG TPA: UbiA family prenyltransferase, partial [Candidatus Aquilonibacter sp.]|nr:UbiA family prenyltransferase [Candidatus Aquilonibacter sp.]